jgi:hypothetical protein
MKPSREPLISSNAKRKETAMMGLDEVRKNREIISVIDWDMTPEEAVTLYLEWGNSWSHGKSLIRSKDDVSHYVTVHRLRGSGFTGKRIFFFINRLRKGE